VVRSEPRELLTTASYRGVFKTPIIIGNIRTTALVDSGADGNFMSQDFAKANGIATRKHENGYELAAADGSSLPKVETRTDGLALVVQRHYEVLSLNVTAVARHDVILGMP
jgi:predicted aspartyl protease